MNGSKAKLLRKLAREMCKGARLQDPQATYKKVYKALKKKYKS